MFLRGARAGGGDGKLGTGVLQLGHCKNSVSTSPFESNTHPLNLTKRPKKYQRFVCCKGLKHLQARMSVIPCLTYCAAR